MTPQLTEQQLAAVQSRDVEVLCEAGAGSGKTEVLVRRCLEAILDDGVELSSVLAITFTDRAAAELRERLRVGLEKAAESADDAEKARELRALARDTEEAWFSTIHGFCRRILAANPVAAGIDPSFGVLDDGEAGRLKKRAFSQALATMAKKKPTVVTRVLASNKRADLEQMVTYVHGAMRADGTPKPELPAVPRDDLEAPTSKGQTEAYGLVRDLLDEFDSAYEGLKSRRIGLDFEDLELRALGLLEGDVGLRYREQFSHLLVDEFQDTNRLQLKLIGNLVGPETKRFLVGDELQAIYSFRDADVEILRGERRRIGGLDDSEALLAPLTGNFRSHAEILALANAIGRDLIGEFSELAVGSTNQIDAAGQSEPRVELLLTRGDPPANTKKPKGPERGTWRETPLPDPGTATNVVVAEARMLASRLAELREVEPKDASFVVLLRKRTHVEAFRRALDEYGLDPHVIGGKDFWQGQQVRDVLALLMLVSNPLDDTALLSALASPACSASPDALWALRKAAGSRALHSGLLDLIGEFDESSAESGAEPEWRKELDPEDLKAMGEFEQRVRSVRVESGTLGLSELIDRLCRDLGYDLATLMRRNGSERWANVRKLQRIAGEFEAQEGADIRGFLEYAADEAERGGEGDAPVTDEASGGVTVMTIHKAKGLEFDVVAVPQLGALLSERGQVARIAFDRPDEDPTADPEVRVGFSLKADDSEHDSPAYEMESLKQAESVKQIEEELRLFHVAATRAQRRLLLSGTYAYKCALAEDGREKPTDKAGMINRIIHSLELAEPEGSSTETTVAIDHPEGIEGITKPTEKIDLRVLWNFPGEEAITRLSPPEPVAPEDGDVSGPADQSAPAPIAVPPASQASRFSFSSLSIFERCGYRFYAERELGLKRYGPSTSLSVQSNEGSEPEEDEGRTSGEIPAPGEEIAVGPDQTNKRYGPGNAVHRLLEWSSQNGWATPSDDLIIVALRAESLEGTTAETKRVKALVEAWLESDVLSSIKERGLSLSAELPFVLSIAGTMINGSIDLVATSPDGGEVEIVDYKTNSLRGRNPDDLMGNYLTQRDIYALAVAHLGENIVSHYVFLEEPDKPVSETYDASRLEQAAEDLTALLSRISEGDFPVTEHPHRALCHDCPAFRLCSHPREIRERDSADPAVEPEIRSESA